MIFGNNGNIFIYSLPYLEINRKIQIIEEKLNMNNAIKRDINEKMGMKDTVITQDKLYGFNTSVFTLFVFMYDLSSFYSFESLIIYYSKIAKIYHLGEEENFKACIIGNKIDKKILFEKEQENVFNEFLKNKRLFPEGLKAYC